MANTTCCSCGWPVVAGTCTNPNCCCSRIKQLAAQLVTESEDGTIAALYEPLT